MVKNHHLVEIIVDASWNQLVQYTTYKAEESGRCVVLVDPKNTSQLCSNCGETVPKKLSERVHRCERYGYVQDRDINAAQNILKRALLAILLGSAEPSERNAGGYAMRVLRSPCLYAWGVVTR